MIPQPPPYAQSLRDQFSSTTLAVGWPKRLFTLATILFISVFLVYVGLAFGYRVFLNNSIEKLDDQLETLSTQITEEQKEDLATLYSQVTNVRTLLKDHVATSQAFTLLESLTHPKVTYLNLDLDMKDRRLILSGITPSYDDLTAQLAIFENSSDVERYNLESSEWDNGVIQFKVNLVMDKGVFSM